MDVAFRMFVTSRHRTGLLQARQIALMGTPDGKQTCVGLQVNLFVTHRHFAETQPL
jgi:hypothetical protein